MNISFHTLVLKSLALLFFVVSIVNLSAATSNDTALNANNDHGFWLQEEVSVNFGCNWSANFSTEQRWGSNYRLLWYQRYEAVLHYDLTKKTKEVLNLCPEGILNAISLGIGYAHLNRIQKNTQNIFHWVGVSRPEIEARMDLKWNRWLLRQRFRVEYRQYHASHYKNFVDYRWRLMLDLPWSFTCWNLTPFVHNEFFIRENTYSKAHPNGLVGGFYENRFRIGLTAEPLEGQIRSEIYWQWRPLKQTPGTHPRWFNTYQFGMNVALLF